jgi:phospholipid-translocating ATPase
MVFIGVVMELFHGFNNEWVIQIFRYVLLLSSIIPISLRVNLDFAKAYFSFQISHSETICPDTVARNSSIPEELGRIEYVLADKTGTLTQNSMIFKRLIVNS